MGANYRLVATRVGDLVKWDSSVNEIERAAAAVLRVRKDTFPNQAITSARAQVVYDWVLSLANTEMNPDERDRQLVSFCNGIVPKAKAPELATVLRDAGVNVAVVDQQRRSTFDSRCFHPEVSRHARQFFVQGNFFHAVFEAAKAYNKLVREKAQSTREGEALMLEVWGCDKGVLKVTPCASETDQNVQDGIKFGSSRF
jgi:hypothetical protein